MSRVHVEGENLNKDEAAGIALKICDVLPKVEEVWFDNMCFRRVYPGVQTGNDLFYGVHPVHSIVIDPIIIE